MNIQEYVTQNLVKVPSGTPVIIQTEAKEIERHSHRHAYNTSIQHYVFRWGGMQRNKLSGFSEEGTVAYCYANGEILKLDSLGKQWGNTPVAIPVRDSSEDRTQLILQKIPSGLYVGKNEIIQSTHQNGLQQFKPLLEQLL